VLNSGWIAVVPRTALQVNQWYGYGWQIIDPNSGAAGYLIAGYLSSGGIMTNAGGQVSGESWWVKIHDLCSVFFGIATIATFILLMAAGSKIAEALARPEIKQAIAAISAAFLEFSFLTLLPIWVWGIVMLIIAIVAVYWLWPRSSYNYNRRRWYAATNEAIMLC
jgi:hypothetical protein